MTPFLDSALPKNTCLRYGEYIRILSVSERLWLARHRELLQWRLGELFLYLFLEVDKLKLNFLVDVPLAFKWTTCQSYDVALRSFLFSSPMLLSFSDPLTDAVHIVGLGQAMLSRLHRMQVLRVLMVMALPLLEHRLHFLGTLLASLTMIHCSILLSSQFWRA